MFCTVAHFDGWSHLHNRYIVTCLSSLSCLVCGSIISIVGITKRIAILWFHMRNINLVLQSFMGSYYHVCRLRSRILLNSMIRWFLKWRRSYLIQGSRTVVDSLKWRRSYCIVGFQTHIFLWVVAMMKSLINIKERLWCLKMNDMNLFATAGFLLFISVLMI